jgi:hydroxymethylbilane synthase
MAALPRDVEGTLALGTLRLGTRGSPLARTQAELVARSIGDTDVAIVVIETVGDRVQDRPLAEIGGKALWTKELDRALLDGDVDIAVHSLKDVETTPVPGVTLAAVLERADPRDRLVGAPGLAAIASGGTVGTSSPRRAAQLRARRPDLGVVPLRGNVETRLRRLSEGQVAATFLAAAGLDRLGIEAGSPLPLEAWLPAASQGAIGVTCRTGDAGLRDRLALLDHRPTRLAVTAERALLAALGGSCRTAVGAHARLGEEGLRLDVELLSPDGAERLIGSGRAPLPAGAGALPAAAALGRSVAADLLARAGPAIRASLEPVA